MKKSLIVLLLCLVALSFAFEVKSIIIVPEKVEFSVDVWLDKPEGSVYQVGEKIEIFVKTTRDAYILVYDINAEGKVRLLFPNKYDDNNFVKANEIKKIPTKPTYSFRVTPPQGKEFIQVIACTTPIPIFEELKELGRTKEFPIISENVEDYVQKKLRPYLRGSWASDITYFYVGKAPAFGTLIVDSDPPRVPVFVDGSYKGETPISILLDEGTHYVTVYFDQGAYSQEVYVRANQTTRVFATLPQATLSLSSSPSGARVFVGGIYRGNTPLTLRLSPGTYTVRFSLEGYREEERQVTLRSGESRSISVTLKPAQATLRLRTIPGDVSVYIDGKYMGRTSGGVLNVVLSPGSHEVRLEKSGYKTDVFTITLSAGEEREIFRQLQKEIFYSRLTISTTPSGATVYLNGYYYGITPLTVYIEAGTYELTLVKPGYKTIVRTLVLDEEVKSFRYTMEVIK